MYNPLQLPSEVLELQSKQIEELKKNYSPEEFQRAVLRYPHEEITIPDYIKDIKQNLNPEEFQRAFLNTPDIDNANRDPLEFLVNRRMRRAEQAKRRRLSRY